MIAYSIIPIILKNPLCKHCKGSQKFLNIFECPWCKGTGRDKFSSMRFSPQFYFLRCILEIKHSSITGREEIKIPDTSSLEFSLFLNKNVNKTNMIKFIDINTNETCLIPLFKTKEECEKYIKKHFKVTSKIYNSNEYLNFLKEQK